MEQIIKFGISNYLQLCVEAGFSQIQSHMRFAELDCLPDYISEGLNKLCELAYGGINNQKLYFTQNDIEKLYQPVPLEYDGMGLLQVDNYMLRRGSNKTYHFMHKTVQEFLAAMHMTKIPDQKSLLQCFQNEQLEMVFVFYAGLTGFNHLNAVELFTTCTHEQHPAITPPLFNKFMRFMALSYQKNCGAWLLYENKLFRSQLRTKEYNMHQISVLIACCAEAKNPAVCAALSNSSLFHRDFCYVNFSASIVTSQLLSSLSYCIAYSGKKWSVCWNSTLSEQDVMSLQKHLIDAIDITGQLVALESKINNSNVMHLFVERFLQPHSTLGKLDLSGSKFDEDCITILSEGLRLNGSVIILELSNCNISSKGILTIAEMLCYNNTLQHINLECNKFAIEAFVKLLKIVKSNTTLRMMKVESSVYNKQIKQQLVIFNRNRKNPLMLQHSQVYMFGKQQQTLMVGFYKTVFNILYNYYRG